MFPGHYYIGGRYVQLNFPQKRKYAKGKKLDKKGVSTSQDNKQKSKKGRYKGKGKNKNKENKVIKDNKKVKNVTDGMYKLVMK